jgi:hypothetical protein
MKQPGRSDAKPDTQVSDTASCDLVLLYSWLLPCWMLTVLLVFGFSYCFSLLDNISDPASIFFYCSVAWKIAGQNFGPDVSALEQNISHEIAKLTGHMPALLPHFSFLLLFLISSLTWLPAAMSLRLLGLYEYGLFMLGISYIYFLVYSYATKPIVHNLCR